MQVLVQSTNSVLYVYHISDTAHYDTLEGGYVEVPYDECVNVLNVTKVAFNFLPITADCNNYSTQLIAIAYNVW